MSCAVFDTIICSFISKCLPRLLEWLLLFTWFLCGCLVLLSFLHIISACSMHSLREDTVQPPCTPGLWVPAGGQELSAEPQTWILRGFLEFPSGQPACPSKTTLTEWGPLSSCFLSLGKGILHWPSFLGQNSSFSLDPPFSLSSHPGVIRFHQVYFLEHPQAQSSPAPHPLCFYYRPSPSCFSLGTLHLQFAWCLSLSDCLTLHQPPFHVAVCF